MAVTDLTSVVIPDDFSAYIAENTMVSNAFWQSGVAVRNAAIEAALSAGGEMFNVPVWLDLGDAEADIVTDDPQTDSTPRALSAVKQIVRKSYLHGSWSAMNLASELSGDDAIARVQQRVTAYWDRQLQSRLIASLRGVLASNEATTDADLVFDISGLTGEAAVIGAEAVIDAGGTMGDAASGLTAIAMHSATNRLLGKADLIDFIPDSEGNSIATYRGMMVVVDDGMPISAGVYTTCMFGAGAFGFGVTAPRIGAGTEVENKPSSGNGGGQQILHSRVNVAVHPLGYAWLEDTVTSDSPSLAELANAGNWGRVFEERKQIPLAFLKHRIAAA